MKECAMKKGPSGEKPTLLIAMSAHDWSAVGNGMKFHLIRKQPLLNGPVNTFVYLKKPHCFVVGLLELGAPVQMKRAELAELAEREESGRGPNIQKYLAGRTVGYAIPILKRRQILPVRPQNMKRIFSAGFTPPRHYQRLDDRPKVLHFLNILLESSRYYKA
jgi:predicted transcriptional regulator